MVIFFRLVSNVAGKRSSYMQYELVKTTAVPVFGFY